MRHFLWLAVVCVMTAFFVSPLLAEDFLPPPFRGDPLSYRADWEFINEPEGGQDIPPDFIDSTGWWNYELFMAWTHAHIDPDIVFWDPQGALYTGDFPGQIDFFLNNWEDYLYFKHIWVQVHFFCPNGAPIVSSVLGANESSDWSDPFIGYFIERNEVDANHFVEYWQMQPNPNMEHIFLDLPPYCWVYEVVIDTWSTDYPIGNEATSWGEVKALFR